MAYNCSGCVHEYYDEDPCVDCSRSYEDKYETIKSISKEDIVRKFMRDNPDIKVINK